MMPSPDGSFPVRARLPTAYRLLPTVARLGLVAFGILLGLAVLEVGLQVGAAWIRASDPGLPVSWLTGNRRVLCVGDSNTYGLYLEDRSNEAYPQQFESFWNGGNRSPRVEVLNLGYPGTNSSRLRRDLPHMLEMLRPDLVILLVGANDCWTAPVPIGEPRGLLTRTGRFIQAHSRLYRLVYMVSRASIASGLEVRRGENKKKGSSGTIRVGDVEFSMGWRRGPFRADFGKDLEQNLAAIAELTSRFGAELVLLTYPSEMHNYGAANIHIRKAAEQTATPLVDAALLVKNVCPREPCPAYLYHDHHPTALGYGIMALALVRQMAEGGGAGAAKKEAARGG